MTSWVPKAHLHQRLELPLHRHPRLAGRHQQQPAVLSVPAYLTARKLVQAHCQQDGNSDLRQKDDLTSSITILALRPGLIHADSNSFVLSVQTATIYRRSLRLCRSLVLCLQAGRCASPVPLVCTLSTTTRRRRLGMIHVCHRVWR